MMKCEKKCGVGLALAGAISVCALAQDAPRRAAKVLGTVKSVSGTTLNLKADSGADVTVAVPDGTRIQRLAPGQTDLKTATPLQFKDIQVGDRMLVRVQSGASADSLVASSIVVMKAGDVAQKQQQDIQDWQKRGAGGIVTAIDAATGTVRVSVTPTVNVAIKSTKDTGYLRYAPNSVKFAEASKGTFDQIKIGDQLRARGARSADGKELTAEEVISGSFRNIAGTITSIDAAAGTITVKDILAKKPVTAKLTPDPRKRKRPPQMAQRIAMLLKGSAGRSQLAATPPPPTPPTGPPHTTPP